MHKAILLFLCVLGASGGKIETREAQNVNSLKQHDLAMGRILQSENNKYTKNDETENSLGKRIIGGTEASECQFPWMAEIVKRKGLRHYCGGTIIDKRHIVTAAHCMFNKDENTGDLIYLGESAFFVLTGSSNFANTNEGSAQQSVIARITIHEKYDKESENDIAILELTRDIKFDKCNQPLGLVNGRRPVEKAKNCQVMGWGRTEWEGSTQNMMYVDVPVWSERDCTAVYESDSKPQHIFCAGSDGKDSCFGDSGGPLVCREANRQPYIYGIVHAGPNGPCGRVGYYTYVSHYLSWIQSNTR